VKASVGLSTGGGLNASFGRAQIPLVPRDPQSEEVFYNYHVVVMRKYGSYEDGSYEEMPKLIDLSPSTQVGTPRKSFLALNRALTDP
jgi:hypothetical protein